MDPVVTGKSRKAAPLHHAHAALPHRTRRGAGLWLPAAVGAAAAAPSACPEWRDRPDASATGPMPALQGAAARGQRIGGLGAGRAGKPGSRRRELGTVTTRGARSHTATTRKARSHRDLTEKPEPEPAGPGPPECWQHGRPGQAALAILLAQPPRSGTLLLQPLGSGCARHCAPMRSKARPVPAMLALH